MRLSLRSTGFVLLVASFALVSFQLAHGHRPSLSLPASTSASTVRVDSAGAEQVEKGLAAGKTRQLARLKPATAAKAAKELAAEEGQAIAVANGSKVEIRLSLEKYDWHVG